MDRISGADWVDIGGGRRGFRSEDGTTGVPGTEVTAGWLNAIQEELLGVIEAWLGEALSATDLTQLRRAIDRRVEQRAGAAWVAVISATQTAPPVSPAFGALYLVPPIGASGAWSGLANRLVWWSGLTWLPTSAPHGTMVCDASADTASASRFLRRTWRPIDHVEAWVPAAAIESAYGFARRASQALANAGVDDERFLTPAMMHRRSRITWQYLGDVVVPPDAYGVIDLTPSTNLLGTDLADSGNGFTAGAVDTGYYHVLVRLRRLIAADVTEIGVRLLLNGTVFDELVSATMATPQRLMVRDTLWVNVGVGDVVTLQAYQIGTASTARTCSMYCVANRMSGY
jgi:hypothetical protein